MTTKEQQTIDLLLSEVRTLRAENNKFREDVTSQVKDLSDQTVKKHTPIYLEQDILRTAQQSIQDAIKAVFTGYQSPLNKLIVSVVDENSAELRRLISDSFTQVIRTENFKDSIVSAFSHKVAKTIISNNDGLFDKVANEMKQDSIFKSKMQIAVSNVVDECLKSK